MIPLLIVGVALVFAVCLFLLARHRRRRMASTYPGSHRRAPDQLPTRMLCYAIETAGTHGLGLIRDGRRS